ncbi:MULTISPECIES: hypothetical protein [unclassified Saccharopolyspora]|uniref:hypothetical protein n=2 Tax=Saccharopolyspora TaxID=1835 RepID=UPI001CD49D5E|nr:MULTISPECIES: hypothetical protein [unclassified Saccharopolyspora]MCA1192224.1 hypothetical protein [Saccharopolyspora sp. 6V]MCA1227571.1 hypothetical protein [Saccharopolyspora sp. 6M]MCA1281698.1 hypothetical protein [Saccharopolyspora sp. 7B]
MFGPEPLSIARPSAGKRVRPFARSEDGEVSRKEARKVAMVWVALAIEAIVLLAVAGVAVRWVNKPALNTPAQPAEQVPAVEPTGAMVQQPA